MASSDAFEIIERFRTGAAAPQRLAGGRAEFGNALRVARAAARTRDVLFAEQRATRRLAFRRKPSADHCDREWAATPFRG